MFPRTILVTNKTNIRYFSGFSGTAGYLVMRGKRGFLFTDSRYHLVAKSVLPRGFRLIDITGGFEKPWRDFLKKHRVKQLGLEGGSVSLRFWKRLKKISPGAKLIDIAEALDEKRMVKKSFELAHIQRAQKITDQIFAALKRWLKAGVSEKAIAWKIESLAHDFGADDISFPPIIGINEHSASPHHQNTDRKLKKGDLILIDMGVIYQGYCSDMTRMLFTNAPASLQRKIYELVRRAQEAGIQKLKAGVTGKQADTFSRSIIKKAGYGENFGHSLGHGVGLDIHELPNLSEKYLGEIPAGCVVTVEPGIYLEGKFGVRLEDMVYVQKNGVVNLTHSPKAIQACTVRLK